MSAARAIDIDAKRSERAKVLDIKLDLNPRHARRWEFMIVPIAISPICFEAILRSRLFIPSPGEYAEGGEMGESPELT